jgi:hypothetical protein
MTAGASPAAKAATRVAWQPPAPAAAVTRHALAEPGQAAERSAGARSPRATIRGASQVRGRGPLSTQAVLARAAGGPSAPGAGPVTIQRCGGHPCPPEGCDLPVLQELRASQDAHSPQAAESSAATGGGRAPSLVREALATPGSGLDKSTRAFMEARFGHGFGTVRVHTGSKADDSAKAVGARAYTVGDHIVFSAGSYAPATGAGQLTLAHELTHVVQQRQGPVDGTTADGGLRISHPSDRFEQEADRVARQVARPTADSTPRIRQPNSEPGAAPERGTGARSVRAMIRNCVPTPAVPAGTALLQRCGGRVCDCRPKADQDQRLPDQAMRSGEAGSPGQLTPPWVTDILRRGTGRPLDTQVASQMDSAFNRSFAQVRVHTDALAAQSAAAVGAEAFTVGDDIVFAVGRYRPHSPSGARLLAHELTHVVQQRGPGGALRAQLPMSMPGDAGERQADAVADAVLTGRPTPPIHAIPSGMQRACGPQELGSPTPDCTPSDVGTGGWAFMFKVNCDELLSGEEEKFSKLKPGSELQIHGFASKEGPSAFNWDLSCHRANRIAELARALRPDCPVVGTFKHGPNPVPVPGLPPDVNPLPFWRTVIIHEIRPGPELPQPATACGPDATDWLVNQMIAAKKNAKVLFVRNKLDVAAFFAPQISPKAKLSAMDILEGRELTMVGEAWKAANKPRPTPEANMQLGEPSATLGVAELATAETEVLGGNVNALTTLTALRDAATAWVSLVGTRRPYDFKNDPVTMQNPKSAHCPDPGCQKTITICPGSPGTNCFEKDLPGNVLFAYIGRFVGFSENALQLGSQWAQLQPSGGRRWDPHEDTQMISFGFMLPTPLTREAFCAALQGAKTGFPLHPCKDCTEQVAASIIDP